MVRFLSFLAVANLLMLSACAGQQVRDYSNILCCGAPDTLPAYHLLREGDRDWDLAFLGPESIAGSFWRGVKSIFGASDAGNAKTSVKPHGASVVDHVAWQTAYSRQGQATVEQLERAAIEKHLAGPAANKALVLNLRVNLTLLGQSRKLVYLPVFLCTYTYGSNGDIFTLVVNGQSGKVYGDRPHTKIGKVFDFVASFFRKK